MSIFLAILLWIGFFALCGVFLWTFNPIAEFGLRMINKFEAWVKNLKN